jgi:hypothetical protein
MLHTGDRVICHLPYAAFIQTNQDHRYLGTVLGTDDGYLVIRLDAPVHYPGTTTRAQEISVQQTSCTKLP